MTRPEYAFRPHSELDRSAAAVVCDAVLDLLRDRVTDVFVDAHSDYRDDLPPAVDAAQDRLRAIGMMRGERWWRDPGMGVPINPRDDAQWRLARAYASYSIHTQLHGLGGRDLATLHDGAHSIVVALTPEEHAALEATVATIGRFDLLR